MKGKQRRHSKQELNDIIKSIGLIPVEQQKQRSSTNSNNSNNSNNRNTPSSKSNHKNTHHHNDSSLFLQSTTKSIPIKTQLQYARNGHAVLHSYIPTSIIQNMKQELIQHSKNKELQAWRQKVEVATKSTQIANSCTTISHCKSTLLQHMNNIEEGERGEEHTTQQQQQQQQQLSIPFLQHFNTWQHKSSNPTVYKLVTSPYLSNIASQLLDVPSVRLYQDSLFHKRYNDGPTPWHSDARMAPFDTSNMITFWIPLDYIPREEEGGTGLLFVDKSHCDFALPFWNPIPKCDEEETMHVDDDNDVYAKLEDRYGGEESVKHYMPLELGDCTVHAGWTLHCANGKFDDINDDDDDDDGDHHHNNNDNNNSINNKKDRYALAITYVDAKAEIRREIQQMPDNSLSKNNNIDTSGSNEDNQLGHHEDRQSFRKWIDEVPPWTPYFEHPLVPIVWPKQ